MRVNYRPETDTAMIEFAEGVPDVEGEEVSDGVIVHFDEDDRPVRIEIYDEAAEKFAGPFAPTAGADAEEYLAISRGEDMDDVIYETEAETRAAVENPTEDED